MSDWQDLDLDEITEWPLIPQCVVALFLALAMGTAGYWYWLTPLHEELAQLKHTERALRQQVGKRASQVAALPKVRDQIEALEERYQYVVQQLPEEEELASLLSGVNVIQSGSVPVGTPARSSRSGSEYTYTWLFIRLVDQTVRPSGATPRPCAGALLYGPGSRSSSGTSGCVIRATSLRESQSRTTNP